MVQKLGENKIRELVKIQRNFDINLIDFDYGFQSKIYPLIPEAIFEELKSVDTNIYDLVAKAGILYSFVLDIPKIKIHISNYGINQHEQGKAKNAPWWDVRDLGLSWLKKADTCLNQALIELSIKNWKTNEISFFKNKFPLIDMVEFHSFYPIHSADIYLKLSNTMNGILEELMMQFPNCNKDELLNNAILKSFIKNYILNKTILEAIQTPALTFISSGMAIQYEELPWQKSMKLSDENLLSMQNSYSKNADKYLDRIINFIADNPNEFPCYQREKTPHQQNIIKKKSGLFL